MTTDWLKYSNLQQHTEITSLRHEVREREGCKTVARGAAKSDSSLLSALKTQEEFHILKYTQLTYKPINL